MNFHTLTWLFCGAITLHNLEETIFLPAWSQSAGPWHRPVNAFEFRFAVIVLTLIAYLLAFLCQVESVAGFCRYLISGYALAMMLNVFFPHLVATIVMKNYTPGLATGLIFNLPVTTLLILSALKEDFILTSEFIYTGPITVSGILLLIPILFFIARKISNHEKN